MGPLSWLAQAPVLGNIPIGAGAATVASSFVAVGVAVTAGLTGGSDPPPSAAPPPVVASTETPVAQPIIIRGQEDQRITLDWPTTGDDPPTSITITAIPDHFRIDPASPLVLIPENDWFGRSTGEYRVCWDDRCSTQQLDIDLQATNDAPTASPDGATTPEGIPVSIDVVANDTDIEGGRPVLTAVGVETPAAGGTASITPDGRVLFQPADDFVGTVRLTYTITDSDGAEARGTVTVEVTGVNNPPPTPAPTPPPPTPVVPTDPSPTPAPAPTPPPPTPVVPTDPSPTARPDRATVIEDSAPIDVDVLANDASADGDITNDTLGIVGAPGQGTARIVARQLQYQPFPDANGVDNVTYQVCETTGMCDSATVALTIAPVNDPPRFLDAGAIAVGEDSGPISISSWATSISAGAANESAQSIGFTVTVDQPTMFERLPALDSAGTFTFTPATDANGTANITVTAVDDGGTANGGNDTSTATTATINVTPVNDQVIAVNDSATINEDDTVGATIDVLANDTDADNDPLTIVSIDTTGVVGGTVTDLGTGLLNYTPEPEFNGTETFSYIVSDGNASTDTATVTITVTPIPDAPVATADAYSTAEDTALVIAAPGLLANDYDDDGDALTITPTPIIGPSNGTLALGTNGAFTYTPTNGFVGTDSFTYQLDDTTGLTSTTTVTITVDSGLTGGGLYLGTTATLGIWNMTIGAPADATTEPDHDLDGNPGITVARSGARSTSTWVRSITGTALALDGPVTLELWSTIEDFEDDEDGHPDITLYDCNDLGTDCVTVRRTHVHMNDYNRGVANWVEVDISLGNVTHTFAAGRQLRLDIEHRHNDLWIAASGGRPSRLAYTLANTAPIAADDTVPTVLEDSARTNIDVLANDTDTNLDTTSVTITTSPTRGTATPQPDGTIDYQPTPDANGADNFTYRVCDTSGLCATATVTIAITPVNDPPAFDAGTDINIDASDPPFSEPGWATGIITGPANESSQTLSFTVVATDPTLFSVQPALTPTGTLSFTPSGTPGNTTITIQLTDNSGTANGGNNAAPPRTVAITLT